MEIKTEFRDDIAILNLKGELDMATADYLVKEFSKLKPKTYKVILDFSGLDFVDSTGVGKLIKLFKDNKKLKCFIVNLQPEVQEIFEILNLSALLGDEVFEYTLEEAVERLNK
ncbi:STAS domain-containing protein [Halonatronum saccharophilum]|uniref:STAS domain-containing protein n=1 Tax=Halonatronum saccharophilum TaxID=150060 RepID=UPI000480792A|nr:STAS domain-containing protein [Halonatronum saccharophilum]